MPTGLAGAGTSSRRRVTGAALNRQRSNGTVICMQTNRTPLNGGAIPMEETYLSFRSSGDQPSSGAGKVDASGAEGDAPEQGGQKMSDLTLVFTVVNIFAGLGLLSQPFALAQLGWVGLVVLVGVCYVMCWTAKVLIHTMHSTEATTYEQMVARTTGRIGMQVVTVGIVVELVGATLTCFEFVYKQFLVLFPSLSEEKALLIAVVVCLPTVWILDFSELTFLSVVGACSNMALALAVVFVASTSPPAPGAQRSSVRGDFTSLALSAGIVVFASGAHATLPGIYAKSGVSVRKWSSLMNYCFAAIVFVYATMAACGYYVFGEDVHVLVTEDIMMYPGGWVPRVATVLILVGSFCKIAPLIIVVGETTEGVLGIDSSNTSKRIYRTVLFVGIATMGYVLRKDVDLIEALTGAVATSLTALLQPAAGFAIVSGALLYFDARAGWTYFMSMLCVLLSVLLLVGNIHEVGARLFGKR